MCRRAATEAEKQRRIPAETDREFREAGFYRVLQPAAFGGLELSYGFHTQLAEEIGKGCPSSAWILGVIACHSWIFGMFPPEAQREFWSGPSGDPSATLATSFFPDGATVKRETDGFRLNGRWKFSSGVDHCQGIILMGFVRPISSPANTGGAAGSPAPPVPYFLFVPRADYKIEDTWHSAGLIATGSNDVILDNVFVPAHAQPGSDAVREREVSRRTFSRELSLPLAAIRAYSATRSWAPLWGPRRVRSISSLTI